jgi:outer membrane protein
MPGTTTPGDSTATPAGGLPGDAAASTAPVNIDLRQVYDWATGANLQSQVASERIRESEARIQQSWAALNPQVRFTATQYNRTVNLAQQGLTGSGFPVGPLVGPFNSFDSRVQVLYTFIDAAARWRVRTAEIGRVISEAQERLARQQVGTLAALAYVQLLAARDQLASIEADIALARRTVKLARNQQEAGVAAGIDVTRASNNLAQQTLRQQAAAQQVRTANLELARITGRPLGTIFQPLDTRVEQADASLTLDTAVQLATRQRVELQVAQLQQDELAVQVSAQQASNSPTLGIAADYGLAGSTPTSNVFGTHNVGLVLNFPLYDGGLSEGRENELRSQLEQARLRREDLRVQVEQDVRTAFLALELAQQQRTTARSGVELAQRELEMASDRFAAGLTTSLEVTSAQATLARAREAETQAQIQVQIAIIRLAASMGDPGAVVIKGGSL